MDSNLFATYFQLGYQHILDPAGYDHMAFLIALCAVYKPEEWKKLIWLATAFTLGHSITLILAGLDIIRLPGNLVEWLIPVTILLAAIWNVIPEGKFGRKSSSPNWRSAFLLAVGFGLIHGLGFSNFLRSSLFPGEESKLLVQLLAFNLGIEFGQLIIVLGIWILAIFAFRIGKVQQTSWTLFISGLSAGIAISLMLA
ncbi:MAG: HupE/UreJ family protein [Bacteroidetes bacterium]|nr:HupE/UreJ family protein [Bacteroidota bacterium]